MSLKIDTKQMDKFVAQLKKKSDSLGRSVCEEGLNKLSAEALRRTKNNTPRDTGNLVRSWMVTPGVTKEGNTYKKELYNTADYAVYVEYGHRTRNHKGWIPGQFMMTRAVDDVEKMSSSIINQVVSKYLKDVFS